MIFGLKTGGTTIKDITVFKNGLGEVYQIINKFKAGDLGQMTRTGRENWITSITGGNTGLQNYLKNLNGAKASLGGYIKSLLKAKGSTIRLTLATTALNIAMGVLIPVIAGILIAGLDKLITTSKEATENLESAKSELESISGELESAESKYADISKRIAELNKLKTDGNITIAQQAELDTLQLQSKELENQIWLLKKKKELAGENVTEAQQEVWDKANGNNPTNRQWAISQTGGAINTDGDVIQEANWFNKFADNTKLMSDVETINYAIREIERLQQVLNDTDPNSKAWGEANSQVKQYSEVLSTIAETMLSTGSLGEDAFNKIKVAISTPSELLSNLNDEFSDTANGAELTGEALFKLYKSGDNAMFNAIVDKLVELGYITKPTADELEKLVPKIEDVKNAATDATGGVTEFSDAISNLKTVSSAIGSLQAAYGELLEDGSVAFSTLADIQENFADVDGKFGIDISDYIDELADGEVSVERFKEILSELTEAKIMTKMTDDQIIDSGENVIAAMLREEGVVNDDAGAHYIVARAKARHSIQNKILAGGIGSVINNLEDEATAAGITKFAYADLVAQEIIFSNNGLDISQKIEALRKVYIAAGMTANALNKVGTHDPKNHGGYSQHQTTIGVSDADLAKAWADDFEKYGDNFDFEFNKDGDGGGGSDEPTWLEKYNEQIELEVARLESARDQGLITEKEYWQSLEKIYTDGYDNFKNSSEAASLDEKERLDTENALREKYHEAHVSAYENEVKELDHSRAMNVITEEQYFAQLTALYNQYYAGQDEYREEAMEAEEELYDKRVELVEKWADAAKEAIEAVGEATEGMVSAMTDFIESAIDTNEENFNLEKSLLQHSLDMNYITEEEYYNSLEELYQGYFASKYLYMEQYWENQEEIYKFEQQQLEDGASAVEDIHAQVVEMIKQEKEDAIDAIDETRDKYLDLIEIRRKALRDLKDEEDYEKDRSEKLASVTELERQLNALSYDTSAAGVRKYKEVYAQLQEAKNELSDLENERSYDLMDRALDDEENAVNDKADGEIDSLNKALQDNEALVAEAWERMNGMDAALFAQLDEYNKQHSTSIKDNITEPWNEAKRALTEYGDAYQAMVTYNGFTKSIGQPGMTDGEYAEDSANVNGKIVGNWTETTGNFLLDLVKVGAGFLSSFASIVGSLSGNPYVQIGAGLVSSFAGLATTGAGMLGNVLSLVGGFASGTNSVSKTGLYRTDELGDELKLIKRPEGNYRILTEGSKVIDAESTERLMRVINNPDLLTRTPVISLDKDVLSGLSNAVYTDQSKQSMNVTNVFNITSTEPKGVASEIKKLMPDIANYTINKMTNKSINSGFKPPVKGMA